MYKFIIYKMPCYREAWDSIPKSFKHKNRRIYYGQMKDDTMRKNKQVSQTSFRNIFCFKMFSQKNPHGPFCQNNWRWDLVSNKRSSSVRVCPGMGKSIIIFYSLKKCQTNGDINNRYALTTCHNFCCEDMNYFSFLITIQGNRYYSSIKA